MKKWILILFIGLLAFCYWTYKYYAPKAIAKALISDETSGLVPQKLHKKVEALKEEVDENVNKLPRLLRESAIEYEDLAVIIDNVEADQLLEAFEEVKSQNWETTDEVFDIGVKHIELEVYELEKFRSLFNAYATKEKIEELVAIAEENQLLTNLSIPLLKETAKSILESRKEEILQKLKQD